MVGLPENLGRWKTQVSLGLIGWLPQQDHQHLGQDDQTTLGDEESIQGLIGKELQIFFAAGADAKLFVKVLVNDGIVSWFFKFEKMRIER